MVRINKYWPLTLTSGAVIAGLGYAIWVWTFAGWFATGQTVRVKVVTAKKITAPAVAEGKGELQAGKEADAVSQLPGVLKEVRVRVGDAVKTGDVVAVLQAGEWLERVNANEAAIKLAAASLNETKSKMGKTAEKLATTRELYRKDLIARREVEEMESLAKTAAAEQERAQAELAQREAALAQTRYLLGLTKIVAPISGIVTRRFAEPGASIAASAVILSIAEPVKMRFTLKLAPADAGLVRSGMTASVRVGTLPGKTYKGTVSDVKVAAKDGRTDSTAEIDIPNTDGQLRPALEVTVLVPLTGVRELIVVPHAAVFACGEERCVYVVEGHRAQLRTVGTGAEISGQIVITSNLSQGEKVIVAADRKIQPESEIRTMN